MTVIAPQTLSVCMIVRNEERYLSDCLESIKEVADQIIILDTGSTDKTLDIARSSGAEIHHFDWCDDFAAARNESIKYATGDWIFWLDADERLVQDSIPELKRQLKPESLPVACKVHIRNIKEDGINFTLSDAHRLFNNNRGIRFTGRIHEQIAASVSQLNGKERDTGIILNHLGYGLSPEETKHKNRRNLELLERMVRDNPDDAYPQYKLAQHYCMDKEFHKALPHFETAYSLNQFDKSMTVSLLNSWAEALMETGDIEESLIKSRLSLEKQSLQSGAYYLMYRISLIKNNKSEAKDWLYRLLEVSKKIKTGRKAISTDVLIDESLILDYIGDLEFKLDNPQKALQNFKQIEAKHPERISNIEKIINILLTSGQYHEAVDYLEKIIRIEPANINYHETLGEVLIKQGSYQDALEVYENIINSLNFISTHVERLAGLYAKTGNMQKAEEIIRKYLK